MPMQQGREFLFYPGCTLSTTAKRLGLCAKKSAEALGFALTELEEWQCCGAVFPLAPDEVAPKLSSVRALVAARDKGLPLVVLCSACFHVLKLTNHQAKTEKDFASVIKNYDSELEYGGEATVLHFLEVLRDVVGFENLKSKVTKPLSCHRLGAYYGCMLLRPSEAMGFDDAENPSIFEDFIRALGAEAIVYPYRNECCGGYKVPEKSAELSKEVMDSSANRGADSLVTACPLCEFNLSKHGSVYYFTELLAKALGVERCYTTDGKFL